MVCDPSASPVTRAEISTSGIAEKSPAGDMGRLHSRCVAVRVAEVSALSGLWRRSLIVRADGTRDVSTWVRWLQGPGLCVDLRQPAARPDFSSVQCLRDLTMPQLDWMAGQDGFAGHLLGD